MDRRTFFKLQLERIEGSLAQCSEVCLNHFIFRVCQTVFVSVKKVKSALWPTKMLNPLHHDQCSCSFVNFRNPTPLHHAPYSWHWEYHAYSSCPLHCPPCKTALATSLPSSGKAVKTETCYFMEKVFSKCPLPLRFRCHWGRHVLFRQSSWAWDYILFEGNAQKMH